MGGFSILLLIFIIIFLFSLVSYSPTLATEYCIDGALKPWEVVHLFSTARNADCTEELLQYISNLRNTRKLTMVYQDPIVLVNTLHSALRSSEAWTNAYCSCGSAKPGAHLLTWDWGAIADDAINWLTRENPENVALLRRMRDIAKEFG